MQSISWQPPKKANGNLTTYVIVAEWASDDAALLEQRDYCKERKLPSATFCGGTGLSYMNFVCS